MAKKYPSHKTFGAYTPIIPPLSEEEFKEKSQIELWHMIRVEAKSNPELRAMMDEVETFYFLLK